MAAEGAALHIVMHAVGKITLFFVAGAIYVQAHITKISQLDGQGPEMKLVRCLLYWRIFHHRYPARRRQLVEIHAHGWCSRCRHGDSADCAWHFVTDEHLLPARPGSPRLLQAESQRGQDYLASVDSMAAGCDRGALHRTVFLR